jgi:predicted Rossmann-fold nucleotide-binding protein
MFEILTLKQTGKIPDTPIILYGSDFWQPLENYFKEIMLKDGEATISPEDLNLYIITDNDEEVIEIIKNAKIRTDILNSHHLGKK